MAVENNIDTNTSAVVTDLNAANPIGSTSQVRELDNHIRGLKNVLLNCFGAIANQVTATHTELNYLAGLVLGVAQASKVLVLNGSKEITGIVKITCTTFVGNLTGNVTGNVTGNLTGNASTASNFSSNRTFNATGGEVTGSATSNNGNYTVNLQIAANTISTSELANSAVYKANLKTATVNYSGSNNGYQSLPSYSFLPMLARSGNAATPTIASDTTVGSADQPRVRVTGTVDSKTASGTWYARVRYFNG